RRARHLLRSPCDVWDDVGLRAHPHADEDAVRRDHASLAARQPRAHVGQAGIRHRFGIRAGARRRAARRRRVGCRGDRLGAAPRHPGHTARHLDGLGAHAPPGPRAGLRLHRHGHQPRLHCRGPEGVLVGQAHRMEIALNPRRVAIVGAALSDTGRVDDKPVHELHYQGVTRALADAGMTKDDIGGFCSVGTGALPPVELAEYLGLRPTWVDSTGVGGAAWEFMLEHAAAAIAVGQVDVVVLSYGSTTRADLKRGRRRANLSFGSSGPLQFEAPYGHALISKYGMATQRHMYEFGTTVEQLAEIAVSARYNAQFNPDAYYREPITIEEVNASRMIADPFTKLHCCIRSDGGGAIVLASEDRARDCATEPVWILGTGE